MTESSKFYALNLLYVYLECSLFLFFFLINSLSGIVKIGKLVVNKKTNLRPITSRGFAFICVPFIGFSNNRSTLFWNREVFTLFLIWKISVSDLKIAGIYSIFDLKTKVVISTLFRPEMPSHTFFRTLIILILRSMYFEVIKTTNNQQTEQKDFLHHETKSTLVRRPIRILFVSKIFFEKTTRVLNLKQKFANFLKN